ncbi:MAG: radical SAM protein [Ferruginibacter sp.]
MHENFSINSRAEITLEANPDDISTEKLNAWKSTGINRLSVGVQSFFDEELTWMNRAHTATDSVNSIDKIIEAGFTNYSIDLIYGSPLLTNDSWKKKR